MAKPTMNNLELILQAGINPKTGLPLKFGNKRCSTKEDIKKVLRKNDEQIAVNKYVWKNLEFYTTLTSQDLERLIYYKGQLCFFYDENLEEFYFMPYALDGTIDGYGRYNAVHPVPVAQGTDDKNSKALADYLASKKLKCVYVPKLPENLKPEDLTKCTVLLSDYTKQLSQSIIPTQQLNDSVIDIEAEVMPFLRTALLLGTGTKGVRVADEDSKDEVREANRALLESALSASPYAPILGKTEFQELTDGTLTKSADYLQAMQAIDNFRLGLHGVPNGGLFDKSQYINNAQTEMNLGGADVSLAYMDGLTARQNFCRIVNSI